MGLVIPNGIENDTPVDAAEIQANYDAIQTYVNSSLINRDGSVAMQQPLTLPGDPTQANHAANKDYVDGHAVDVAGDEMTGDLNFSTTGAIGFGTRYGQHINLRGTNAGIGVQANNVYLRSESGFQFFVDGTHSDTTGAAGTGGTVAAQVTPTAVLLPATQSTAGTAAIHNTYADGRFVNKTGDTMTGTLLLPASQSGADHAAIHREWALGKFLSRDVSSTGVAVMVSDLHVNQDADSGRGISLQTSGRIHSNVIAVNTPNMTCQRTAGDAMDVGEPFIRFVRGATTIGEIKIASSSTVAYDENSAARLKERVADATDAADLVHGLGAKAYRGRWLADDGDGEEWVFLNSTDVEAAAPFAVRGEMVDYSKLVPTLCAALSQALDRIEVLEATR